MGRAFEYRKARKMKRWGNMARVFTKLGKEIEMAVKSGGDDPHINTRLRILMQNGKAANMPKETVDRAIKRAISKDTSDYKEVVFEGYGPYGVAILVETATDNNTRTVANVRSYFNKGGGSLGTAGSLSFVFDHKCVFKFADNESFDLEQMELELIDFGVEELTGGEDDSIYIYGSFESYGLIQAYLEERNIEILSGEFVRIPTEIKDVTKEQREAINKLEERFQDDDDVTNVFTNMREEEEEE